MQLTVPDLETFQKLVDVTDLPESTLENAATREVLDVYLDTNPASLMNQGMDVRLSTVDTHHFLIFAEVKFPGKLLASTTEHVERLTKEAHAAALAGERSNPLFARVAAIASAPLEPVLIRHSTLQSRLFKIGETRFEFALEAVIYERNGREVAEQLASLDLIEGDQEVLGAMAQYFVNEYNLERSTDTAFQRGVRLTQ